MTRRRSLPENIVAVVSDVDGTLVRSDKSISPKAAEAVGALRRSGVQFAIVSSRPPRGLKPVISRLNIVMPVAGFNGGVIASPDLSAITSHLMAVEVARLAVDAIEASGANAWVFSGEDWFVRDRNGPRVALEERTVGFGPTVVADFAAVIGTAAKIVAVSDDFALLTKLQGEVREQLSGRANMVRSQTYYLDFTHPLANKGQALIELTKLMAVPATGTAAFGDGDNDVDMFAQAGLSIAMGNAGAGVKEAADFITGSNDDDGVAAAIEWFILGGRRAPIGSARAPREVA
jgi:Cof subfamily protein (haloacid dehalogenase superfamily)